MKVVAFNGSPKKEGNTSAMIKEVFKVIENKGIETEMIQLGGSLVRGCVGCGKCKENKNCKCVINEDIINECIAKMIEADAVIIGSPTYFSNCTTEVKALIDRAGYVARANGFLLRRKIGTPVVAVRRAGAINVINSINDFFLANDMIIPGSSYWSLGVGLKPGDFLDDEEGVQTMKRLGENIAWLLNKIKS